MGNGSPIEVIGFYVLVWLVQTSPEMEVKEAQSIAFDPDSSAAR
jgi:hypothetical protein